MNHNVGREYETCRSFAIVWIRWWIDNEWINWFFIPIWAWLFDFPRWTAIILELFELWLNVQFSQGAVVVLLLLELSVIDRKFNSFLFAPLWWMRLDPRRKRYFVFPLIPGNKIVVNNDDNVHIVPIQCTRHPTMAHYNNPQKQYTVYFRILGIAATPTELEIMAISFHGFALFCNFRRIFPYKKFVFKPRE